MTGTEGFAKACDFCTMACSSPENMKGRYFLVTNVWNEKSNIDQAFQRVSSQTLKPELWLWMDDGSNDGTGQEIERCRENYSQIRTHIESMPIKNKPNFFTLGKTHEKILHKMRSAIDKIGVEYMAILDVDSQPCPNYFARMVSILDSNPRLGAISGEAIEEIGARIVQPMNSGKMIRWSVVREIEEFWDFCPDTFYNIKALAAGFQLKVFSVPIHLDRPTTATTSQGAFRAGRLAYYGGRPFFGIILRSIRRQILGQHGKEMMQGYLSEMSRGTWKCKDQDVLKYYRNDWIQLINMLAPRLGIEYHAAKRKGSSGLRAK